MMRRQRFVCLSAGLAMLWGTAYASEAGIPQMDQTWYPNQLLWLAVSFALLYVMVSLFIAPTAAKILGVRADAIAEAIAEAQKANAAAETTRTHYEMGGQTARAKASELMANAQSLASKDMQHASQEVDRMVAAKLTEANARIDAARSNALAHMQEATASLAAAMSTKLLGRAVSNEEASAATAPFITIKKAS